MAIQLNSDQTYRGLTNSQLLIWTGQQLNRGVPLYNMALIYTIEGAIDADLFRRSMQRLVDDCDSLRTVFEEVEGQVRQRVLDRLAADVELLDFSAELQPSEALVAYGDERCRNHFDLATCTFDTALIKLAAERYAWYYCQHHIATDASSFAVIFSRVEANYAALSRGEDLAASPPLPPYSDYLAFESESRKEIAASREWFRKKSQMGAPPLYGRPNHNRTTLTRRVTWRLERETCQRLRSLAAQPLVRSLTRHASQFNLIAALLFALLYRISGQRALAIGAPSHNRLTRNFKQSIGLFIEVFPLSVEIDKGETFNSLLQKIKTEATSFMRHARPGASDSKDQRSFNTILNYITATFGDFCGMDMKSQWLHTGACDRGHVMRLQVHDFDNAGDLVLHFDLNVESFDELRQTDLIQHFKTLLAAMLDDLDQPIDAVDLLHETEKQRLRRHYGRSNADLDAKTVVEQFEEQVATQPNAAALICGEERVTYFELDRRADAMASELKSRGVAAGDHVAICLPRSVEAIASILATLKARASYVPIDATYPRQRIEFMLRDAGNPFVFTDAKGEERLPASARKLLIADGRETPSLLPADASKGPSPDDAAYTIYTSGSTGKPKGVVVTHRNLSHYIGWASEKYVRSRKLSFPFFSPMAFDLTATSIFLPLVTGGELVIYPQSDSKADLALLDVVEDDLVDVIKLTPSHLALLKGRQLQNSRVRQLILGGEDLRCDVAKEAFDAFGKQLEIHNEYGPTEATVGCIHHSYDAACDVKGSVPIGKPIRNMQAYVLNDELKEVPQGVVGELFVAGSGLAAGYWNRPELTAERFVENPFQPEHRMYRTGDLARIRDDGVFEYHGRTDQQVKIRGVRIELGEVESALAAHPKIDDCVVDLVNRGGARLREEPIQCRRCGLPSNYPNASFDDAGICHLCNAFDSYEEKAQHYFRSMDDLRRLFASAKTRNSSSTASYDCISLLSGGKDSTYMLAQLVDMGLRVLAFTLDNGYISDEAKANIKRVVETLGVDHTYGSTPAMNQIFVDSLNRHANVCQGCFKTIYTLSMQLARERKIPLIVTGLSRGQFFETRLTEELFTDPNIDSEAIDATILRARKEYHRVDDAVSRLLDVEMFQDDAIFDEVQFVDFYRYCDVELDEMLAYLDQRLPWVRPTDTGRSTNCLINDVGIHVHKLERGYHNYAFPYSWDVRIGHKQRDAAIQELDDEIDEADVSRILEEIGYRPAPAAQEQRLVAYYVASAPLTHGELHAHLSAELPDSLIPSHFVRLDAIPLTANGKIDRNAFPSVGEERPELIQDYVAPQTENQAKLAQIWQNVLRIERIGIRDNFFDLGGDSVMAIQIIARANQAGLQLNPTQLFDTLTVEKLATVVGTCSMAAEQGIVTGPVRLAPIQHWFFEQPSESPIDVSQVFRARASFVVDDRALLTAFQHAVRHHDALRIAYRRTQNQWAATNLDAASLPDQIAQAVIPSSWGDDARNELIHRTIVDMHQQLDIATGQLIKMAKISEEAGASELLFVAHHLCMDAASWPILIEDLMTAYDQVLNEQTVRLPLKTSSFQHWSEVLSRRVQTDHVVKQREKWLSKANATAAAIPTDAEEDDPNRQEWAVDHVARLDSKSTQRLIEELPAKNRRVHEVLTTSLARTLAAWRGHNRIQLDVEGHGREPIDPNVDVSRTVGWFTSLYPVSFSLSNDSLVKDYDSIRDELSGQDGLSYGLLRYLSSDDFPVESSRVLFNYLGHAGRLLPHDCKLEFTQPLQLYRPADYIRRYDLEINAMVVGERLEVTWTYNRRRHDAPTIENLSRSFQSNLEQLVTRLLDPNATSVSAADFPQAKLDSAKLTKLSQLLGRVDSDRGRN